MGTKKQPKPEVAATPEGMAFMNNIKAMVPKVTETPENDLPAFKGTTNTYYQIAKGKNVLLCMNVKLDMFKDTRLVWRFATVGGLSTPPVHLNYRGMAKFLDSDGHEQIGMYLDQHKMVLSPKATSLYALQMADDSQGISSALALWVDKQVQLEGMTRTADLGEIGNMVRGLWADAAADVLEFTTPKDIWHEKKTYDKGSPAQGGDDE